MLEERLRNHIDSIAAPVELGEVLGGAREYDRDLRSMSEVSARPVVELQPPDVTSRTHQRMAVAAAAVLVVLAGGLFYSASRDDGAPLVSTDRTVSSLPALSKDNSNPSSSETTAVPDDALALFEQCVTVLERPELADIPVVQDGDHRVIVQQDSLDPVARLCRDVINERAGSLPISDEQSAALADGITEAEYDVGWERFVSCMERGGGEVTRVDEEPGGLGYAYTFTDEVLFLHDVCYAWHLSRVDTMWQIAQNESQRAQARAKFIELLTETQSVVSANTRRLFLSGLTAESEGCQTTYGDRWWITTFDSMPQPLCLIVGEEQDLDFWNKGFATATVEWAGAERTLRSDSSFETGRIGDTFPAGKHVVAVEPYGNVTLIVIPEELSVMAGLKDDLFWDTDVVRGLGGGDVADLLGVELEVEIPPRDGCLSARVAGDPYSPQFTLLGDGTMEGSVVVNVTYDDDAPMC